jgi:hypothetical protein
MERHRLPRRQRDFGLLTVLPTRVQGHRPTTSAVSDASGGLPAQPREKQQPGKDAEEMEG